jgi:hypothetical protein
VAWGVGVMGAAGIPMDVFNATTPILILAVATGHAVQMLKRYYDEYHALRRRAAPRWPHEANRRRCLARRCSAWARSCWPPARCRPRASSRWWCSTSAPLRTFGIFTASASSATVLLEMTFIPALRAVLAPPRERRRPDSRRYGCGPRDRRLSPMPSPAQPPGRLCGAVLFAGCAWPAWRR